MKLRWQYDFSRLGWSVRVSVPNRASMEHFVDYRQTQVFFESVAAAVHAATPAIAEHIMEEFHGLNPDAASVH